MTNQMYYFLINLKSVYSSFEMCTLIVNYYHKIGTINTQNVSHVFLFTRSLLMSDRDLWPAASVACGALKAFIGMILVSTAIKSVKIKQRVN